MTDQPRKALEGPAQRFQAVLDGKVAGLAHYRWDSPTESGQRSLCNKVTRPLRRRGFAADELGQWILAADDAPLCGACEHRLTMRTGFFSTRSRATILNVIRQRPQP